MTLTDSIAIACPVCKTSVIKRGDSVCCDKCGRKFAQTSDKFINLVPEDKFEGESFKSWEARQGVFIGWFKNIMNETLAWETKGLFGELFEYTGDVKGLTLDVGCSDGHISGYIKDAVYVGIDPYDGWFLNERPAYMDRVYPIDKDKLIFIKGFGEYLPFGDGVFDNIIITNALDHSYSPYQMLGEALRALKRDGRLYLMHENPDLLNKIMRSDLRQIYRSVFRRLRQLILIGSVHTPHIKLDRKELDDWLCRNFVFESKLSKERSHIFYKSIKKA